MIIDSSIQASPTLQFSIRARELKQQGRPIISLGLGEPDFDTPDHIKQAAVDALWAGMTRYAAAPGLPELRELVAHNLQRHDSIQAQPDEIVITPGAKNALFVVCAAILQPGDEVINLSPSYVSYPPILKLAEPQCVIHHIPLLFNDNFCLDRQRIVDAVSERTRLLLINYPNNPTGKMIDEEDFSFLSSLLEANPNIYLLSDEIYARLPFGDKPHLSPASQPAISEQVITVSGFSKTYAMTGWRIGYSHAPKSLTSVFINIHQQINTNTAVFIQKGAVAALTGPQDHLPTFISRLRLHATMLQDLARKASCHCSPAEGGLFGALCIEQFQMDSDRFAACLLDETGVATTPGVAFGSDFDGWLRISLATPTKQFVEGLTRIEEFMGKQR